MEVENDFPRPDGDVIDGFRDIPAAIAGDAMGRTRCTSADLALLGVEDASGAGSILTVETPEGTNRAIHRALEEVQTGDVLVVDAGGATRRAVWGEVMSVYCEEHDVAAVVIDGAVRDGRAHANIDLPVYCRGTTPRGPHKTRAGRVGGEVSCDGAAVRAGWIAVYDSDGVAFVPRERANEVLERAREKLAREEEWFEQMTSTDRSTIDILGLERPGE